MDVSGRVVVVTGGAGGIGSALGRRFAAEGARSVVLADLDLERTAAVAEAIGPPARALACDVADPDSVRRLVADVEAAEGRIDLFCSNAGIGANRGLEADDAEWERVFRVNVFATVSAARALLPGWLERGEGYLLVTASAAGLLTTLGDGPYAASKHAAVGLAEWLAITYGDRGVKVSCLCPQGVRTPMVFAPENASLATAQVRALRVIEPDEVAQSVVEGLADERFLILPHPEVADYVRAKAADEDRWLRAMRRMQASLLAELGG